MLTLINCLISFNNNQHSFTSLHQCTGEKHTGKSFNSLDVGQLSSRNFVRLQKISSALPRQAENESEQRRFLYEIRDFYCHL